MTDKKKPEDNEDREYVPPPEPEVDTEEKIWVQSTKESDRDGGDEVVLHEIHSQHPGGEVFIAGKLPVEAAQTPQIAEKLARRQIKKLTETEAKKIIGELEKAREEKRKAALAAQN